MPTDTRIWRVSDGDRLEELPSCQLDREERLEVWLERDISILAPDLLVIGRQVPTAYNGFIDLLCIDADGDLTIIEMKRDKTPREITAQALDYASWVAELSHDEVSSIADGYFSGRGTSFAEVFQQRFGDDLPEILNENHSMIVLGSRIDDSSERIVRYLSEQWNVPINAASFKFLGSPASGGEFLARTFLLEPSAIATGGGRTSKRAVNLTPDQLAEIADQKGVGPLYEELARGFHQHFRRQTTLTSLAFTARIGESRNVVLTLIPGESNPERGVAFHAYTNRLSRVLGITPDEVKAQLPAAAKPWQYTGTDPTWSGLAGHFDRESARTFLTFLAGCGALSVPGNG